MLRGARGDRVEKIAQARTGGLGLEEGGELQHKLSRIVEGKLLGVRFDEEIEWVDDLKIGDEVDRNGELLGRFGKDVAGEPVSVRVLFASSRSARPASP